MPGSDKSGTKAPKSPHDDGRENRKPLTEGESGESPAGPQPAPRYEDLPEVFEVRTRQVLRVISHPLRYAALEELSEKREPRTAAQIAEVFGVSTSAMSYHLRELGKVGIIHRVEGVRDRRESPWMLSVKRYRIVVSEEPDPDARMKMMSGFLAALRRRVEGMLVRVATGQHKVPREVSTYTIPSTGNLVLTREESIAAQHEIREVWNKCEALSHGRKPSRYEINAVYVWSCLPDDAHGDAQERS